jgi:glycosyltransferase involved in cell wall biosynthesis
MANPAQALTASRPPLRKKLSERWYAKVGIRVFGFERLLDWYLSARHLRVRTRAALNGASRLALKRRTELISSLKVEGGAGQTRSRTDAPSGNSDAGLPRQRRRGALKIAVFIPGFHTGKGGAEKVAGRVAATLAEAGNTVHLCCRPQHAGAAAYRADEGVEVRHVFERDDDQIEALRPENYDLVIGFAMRGFYLRIAAIARMLGAPFIIQECNNPRFIALNLRGAHMCRDDEDTYWLRQAVFAHAAGIRLTVPHYAESVEREMKPFTYAFYNSFAAPTPHMRPLAKKFICVGAMKNAQKNGLDAIAAFCEFAAEHPGWSLHLYGENKYRAATQQILKRFPGAAIIDHGIIHDIDEIYGDAHALLIPSFHEGLPNVVIEAFSYGVPCIGYSDCEGVNQLIKDDDTGLLLDRAAPGAMTDAMRRTTDPDVRTRLSVNARRFAEENLRLEQWEANWLRLVENAANGLNNKGERQSPVAQEPSGAQAAQWSALLETYLHFGDHADGRRVRFANGEVSR